MCFDSPVYATLDLYLAAFLLLSGLEPELENRNGKVIFKFPANGELYDLTMSFNSNAAVPVADFTVAIKTLRSRMLALRNKK